MKKKTASLVLSVIIICISVRHYRTSKGVRSNPSNPPSYAPEGVTWINFWWGVLLATKNSLPILVHCVANCLPHLTHFWAKAIFVIPTTVFPWMIAGGNYFFFRINKRQPFWGRRKETGSTQGNKVFLSHFSVYASTVHVPYKSFGHDLKHVVKKSIF